MKNKTIIVISLFLVVLISFFTVYIYTGVQNRNKCEATYIKDADGYEIGISYNGRNYYDLYTIMEDGSYGPHVSTEFDDFPLPYSLVTARENEIGSDNVYIEQDKFSDYTLSFDKYFNYYSGVYDNNKDFIVVNNKHEFIEIYVDENFVFPTVENNKIDEVWMSHSSSYEIIKDEATVDKIVACAKSDGKIELDKEIVDYIKKYSWDYHCFYLKYEGYPIVEEFHIEETEDGRYIIDQYTPEEYNTIYWEEEAHQ